MAKYVGVLASAARTTSATSPTISISEKYEAAHIVVDITSGTAFNLDVAVRGYDPASAKSYTILSSAINASGTTVMKIGPDYTATANIAKDLLPAYWNVVTTVSGGISVTYSIGASII